MAKVLVGKRATSGHTGLVAAGLGTEQAWGLCTLVRHVGQMSHSPEGGLQGVVPVVGTFFLCSVPEKLWVFPTVSGQ